mmetsp:Transcript_46499/g.63325  ORF Transcript_46499/g.63325 Transcript_46499/m.63325 type:complete len:179 (-) Transcript_46499:128-664(-)|eukprot:CAMPEP_0185751928 /NCGR_PEP_ID=MMETSP1174-20130828/10693_1 /TAXON_ID=35687 /ORGANISM="Dictyocha speculum, Strain CCMP1381" /LENGTH=178 /DNA_ID=CAMNT_0028429121 /DNA_START=99 /DNA_END=635 /DNA_ORIENTATION=+
MPKRKHFDADVLGDSLNRLAVDKWWDALEEVDEEDEEEEEDDDLTPLNVKKMKVVELKSALEKRGLSTDGIKRDLASRLLDAIEGSSGDNNDEEIEDILQSEMNLYIREVRPDGWVMEDLLGATGDAFVRLPPEVAAMGRPGVNFSLMILGLRNGIWRPLIGGSFGDFEAQVFAEIYS